MSHAVEIFELILILLLVVMVLHWLAHRIGLPPSTALLIGGGALAFIPGLPHVEVDPQLVLVLFLPPLLLDGAFFTAIGRFRRYLPGILSLAVGAAIFTTLAVGVVVHWVVPELPWAACFALGAVVSPPDAVSARAVLQHVKVPRRLSALIEGESLLNDATGLVLFRFAVAATMSGTFELSAAAGSFVTLVVGGGAVGFVVARLLILVLRRLNDEMLTIIGTAMVGWISYIAAERLGFSGVIATVTTGLIMGWHQHTMLRAGTRLRGQSFWRTLVFVLEALVFILIGFSLRGAMERIGGFEAAMATMTLPVLAVILTVTLARFAWLYGLDGVLHLLRAAGSRKAYPLGWRQATVLGWSGMRGVVTLAVALSLPVAMPGRDLILVAAFGVIFATVVIQGTSLGWLVRVVDPSDDDPIAPLTLAQTEAALARARYTEVERIAYDEDGTLIHPKLLEQTRRRQEALENYAKDTDTYLGIFNQHFDVILQSIAAARAELIRIHREGLIEDEILHELERDLDVEEIAMILQRTS